ncbi:MAG: ATP-binding protein [Clostridiales bacterium]|nr:ATP-binding protein [Clostridiales bacterium]
MGKNKLEDKIAELIFLKQEGEYWDFKKEWHSNNADLLHDIICMSNNLTTEDGLIIIGIDESNNYSIVDISSDKNRKSTQNIVDFLKDKKFAGGIRPTVYVETVIIENKKIDVLIIKNDTHTPYYLEDQYQGVFAGNIYTRIMDTNTPKNKSADIDKVEFLWKKRFGLTFTALDKCKVYLANKSEWTDIENGVRYYKYSPEFTIKIVSAGDERNGYEFYLFSQTDSTPHWFDINLYYHNTLIFSAGGVALDGGRCFTSAPLKEGIFPKQNSDIWYNFYIKDSIEYALHNFFKNNEESMSDESWARKRFLECIVLYNSESEKNDFENYIIENIEEFNSPTKEGNIPHFEERPGYNMAEIENRFRNALKLNEMLIEFRSIKK